MFRLIGKYFFSLPIFVILLLCLQESVSAVSKQRPELQLPKKVELQNQERAISQEYSPKVAVSEASYFLSLQLFSTKVKELEKLFPLLNPEDKYLLENLRGKVYLTPEEQSTLKKLIKKGEIALEEREKENWHIRHFLGEITSEVALIIFCHGFYRKVLNSKYHRTSIPKKCENPYELYERMTGSK